MKIPTCKALNIKISRSKLQKRKMNIRVCSNVQLLKEIQQYMIYKLKIVLGWRVQKKVIKWLPVKHYRWNKCIYLQNLLKCSEIAVKTHTHTHTHIHTHTHTNSKVMWRKITGLKWEVTFGSQKTGLHYQFLEKIMKERPQVCMHATNMKGRPKWTKEEELSDHKTIQREAEDFQYMRMKRSKSLRRVCISEHLQNKRNNKN